MVRRLLQGRLSNLWRYFTKVNSGTISIKSISLSLSHLPFAIANIFIIIFNERVDSDSTPIVIQR